MTCFVTNLLLKEEVILKPKETQMVFINSVEKSLDKIKSADFKEINTYTIDFTSACKIEFGQIKILFTH